MRSREQTLTNKNNPNGATTALKDELDGSRHVAWKTVTPSDTTYQIAKESTHTGTSTLSLQKKDGTTLSFSTSIATGDSAPLEILVVRDKTTLALQSRTIQSGTIEATHKDGTRIETVFKQVVYNASADDQCMASSGEIDGSIFAPAQTTAALTFVITFGDDPMITFSNGTSIPYVQAGCELDEPATGDTEAASKAAVTAPAQATPAAA